jgi:hypothetical protein
MNFPYSRSAAHKCVAIQSSDKALMVSGRSLNTKMTLRKIPVKAAVPIAKRRKMRNRRLWLMARILGRVNKRANGPEKRMLPIMRETTKARDSIALLSNIARWPPLVI